MELIARTVSGFPMPLQFIDMMLYQIEALGPPGTMYLIMSRRVSYSHMPDMTGAAHADIVL
jgi:hypothetical protein